MPAQGTGTDSNARAVPDHPQPRPLGHNLMPKDAAILPVTVGALPASRKVYVCGERDADLRVPLREIDLSSPDEKPLRVYDTSGPYTDPAAGIDIRAGLPPLRGKWMRGRGDVEECPGRNAGDPAVMAEFRGE